MKIGGANRRQLTTGPGPRIFLLLVLAKARMTRDPDVKNPRLFDRRIVERNIKKGLVSRKDYEKHLKALDDVADKGVYGHPEEEPAAEGQAARSPEGDGSNNSH
jgi:hypothetical protein